MVFANSEPNAHISISGNITGKVSVADHMEFLLTDQDISLEKVQGLVEKGKFRSITRNENPAGYTDGTIWLHTTFDAEETAIGTWVLFAPHTTIDAMHYYFLSPDGKVTESLNGRIIPIEKRDIPVAENAIPLHFQTGGTYELFLKIRHTGVLAAIFHLQKEDKFFSELMSENILQGAYLGLVLALIIYHLNVFRTLKNWNSIYFVLYLLSYVFFILIFSGIGPQYIWPDTFVFGKRGLMVGATLLLSSIAWLAIQYLKLKELYPVFYKIAITLCISGLILSVAIAFFDFLTIHKLIYLIIGIGHIFSLFIGIYLVWRGDKSARYFLGSRLASNLGSFLFFVRFLDFFPAWDELPLLFFAETLASLDAIIFSFGLENQYKELEKERQDALERASLSEKLVQHLSHQLRTPLTNFRFAVDQLLDPGVETTFKESLLSSLNQSAASSLVYIDRVLQLNRLKKKTEPVAKISLNIHSLVGLSITSVSATAERKQVILENSVDETMEIQIDPDLFIQVLVNLLSNSVKFTPAQGKVQIFDNEGDLVIADNGIGMTPDTIQSIQENKVKTTLGTAGEIGNGIGLAYCMEVIRLHQGTLSIKSEKGKGTEIRISLP